MDEYPLTLIMFADIKNSVGMIITHVGALFANEYNKSLLRQRRQVDEAYLSVSRCKDFPCVSHEAYTRAL